MNANLKAVFDCFIDKILLKCLVVNDNVNKVYLMMSYSMSRSMLLQFSSRQFFVSLALLVKKGNRDYRNEFTHS